MTYKINGIDVVSSDKQGFFANAVVYSSGGVNFYEQSFQGTISGYTSGGKRSTFGPSVNSNVIDRFPFATNANATDVGDLLVAGSYVVGQSSSVSGYTSGGYAPPSVNYNTINKFPFAIDSNATDVGDLTVARFAGSGQSSSVSGYTSGGYAIGSPSVNYNTIDKFPFATNANASDVGDLTRVDSRYSAGQSSTESGYTSGGGFPTTNIIDKFSFASDGNATDVGDLILHRRGTAGQSSAVSGYNSGGYATGQPTAYAKIDKFPFATNANATDVGDITEYKLSATGQSSTDFGYTSGGNAPAFPSDISTRNTIDRFPFATDTSATNVGDLTLQTRSAAGQQI